MLSVATLNASLDVTIQVHTHTPVPKDADGAGFTPPPRARGDSMKRTEIT
jgi:hypothetical protein